MNGNGFWNAFMNTGDPMFWLFTRADSYREEYAGELWPEDDLPEDEKDPE